MYPCYPKKTEDCFPKIQCNFPYIVKKNWLLSWNWVILQKTKVVYTCLRGNKTLQCIIVCQWVVLPFFNALTLRCHLQHFMPTFLTLQGRYSDRTNPPISGIMIFRSMVRLLLVLWLFKLSTSFYGLSGC